MDQLHAWSAVVVVRTWEVSLPWTDAMLLKVVDPRKLDLRQKQIILLSRIAILLLKGYFGREKISFNEKNLKYRKIILLINFFLLAGHKVDFIAPCGSNKSIFWPHSRKKIVCNTGKTFILLAWLLPSLCSGIKLYTRKINFFFLVAQYTIFLSQLFFLLLLTKF